MRQTLLSIQTLFFLRHKHVINPCTTAIDGSRPTQIPHSHRISQMRFVGVCK